MSFQSLNLDQRLLRAVEACGYSEATPIQSQAIPIVLEGRDLMASAQTGTGKTAAFVLPAMQRLFQATPAPGAGPRVLVLTPTRELALQVKASIDQLSRFSPIRAGLIVGGVPYPAQMRMLRAPMDFMVATPGRLLDHMQRGRINFGRVELLILDEADRMLDMGFIEDVETIAAATPATRQTLLFSATLEGAILKISQKLLKNPARIQLAPVKERHNAIAQHIHLVDNRQHKDALLTHLLNDPTLTQAVVFTATKRGADELADDLMAQGHRCAALHGDMKQGARRRTMERMHQGKFRILVATDVAARGLDIKGLSHVINYDLPMVAEDYVHRIGRTGRGGAQGIAVSLVNRDDWSKLADIERFIGRRIDRQTIVGLEPKVTEPQRHAGPRPGKKRGGGQGQKWSASSRRPRATAAGAPAFGHGRKDLGQRHQPRGQRHRSQARD